MSTVLHPVGPEPRERYWVRRVAVLVAVIVAIGVVIALVGNAMSAGSAVQAEPAPPTSLPPTVPVTASASPTPGDTASPTPTGSPTPGTSTPGTSTPGTSTPTAGATPTTAPATPGSTVTPNPNQTSKAERSTKPTDADKRKAQQQAAEKKAAAQKKAKAKTLATCPGGDLRQTLIGPKKVEASKKATFTLSLINGSGTACYLKVTHANFTLTVVSGKDRIWSTDDCPKAVPAQSRRLASQKAVGWKVVWNGDRSAAGCAKRKEDPKPGYYWAIAKFDDAREVRWRLILT